MSSVDVIFHSCLASLPTAIETIIISYIHNYQELCSITTGNYRRTTDEVRTRGAKLTIRYEEYDQWGKDTLQQALGEYIIVEELIFLAWLVEFRIPDAHLITDILMKMNEMQEVAH